MTYYEVRVTQAHVDYYRIEADSAEQAEELVINGVASGIMGNIELNDTIRRSPKFDYAVQLSPEGEVIL
jgi:hypothetical protein